MKVSDEHPSCVLALQEDTMPTIFFDSWGAAWTDHPDASAFGPAGVARPATDSDTGLPPASGTAWSCAERLGRLVRDAEGGWDTLSCDNPGTA